MHVDRETRAKVIIEVVANAYGYTGKKIRSRLRERHVVEARHVAMFIVREQCQLSFSEIARLLGRKDHATVIRAIENVRNWIQTDRDFKARWPGRIKEVVAGMAEALPLYSRSRQDTQRR